jgi:hypothetical protein
LRAWLKEHLKDSQSDLIDLSRLALKSTPTADLMKNALLLASELDLSAYDACYALLAQQLGIRLVTADQPLARKLEFAVFLGDFGYSASRRVIQSRSKPANDNQKKAVCIIADRLCNTMNPEQSKSNSSPNGEEFFLFKSNKKQLDKNHQVIYTGGPDGIGTRDM